MTYHEFKLLNRNLNFIPNPCKYNSNKFEEDKNRFIRSMILKSYFGNEDNEEKDPYRALRQSNKDWIPNEINHKVATYIENFEKTSKTHNQLSQ